MSKSWQDFFKILVKISSGTHHYNHPSTTHPYLFLNWLSSIFFKVRLEKWSSNPRYWIAFRIGYHKIYTSYVRKCSTIILVSQSYLCYPLNQEHSCWFLLLLKGDRKKTSNVKNTLAFLKCFFYRINLLGVKEKVLGFEPRKILTPVPGLKDS